MNRFLIPILTVIVGLSLYGGSVIFDQAPVPKQAISIAPNAPAPVTSPPDETQKVVSDFSVSLLNGQAFRLSDLRGRVVILNFWATWCAPCVREFPDLLDIVDQHKGSVVLFALSSDMNADPVQKFIADQENMRDAALNPNWVKIAMDTGRKITRDQFGITTYPESFIINRHGRLVRHIIGIEDWGNPKTQDLIKELVQQRD